jgi:hypothetical protein
VALIRHTRSSLNFAISVGGSGGIQFINFIQSIEAIPGGIATENVHLKGDVDLPGKNKYYGTDDSEVKGFHAFPTGGSDLTYEKSVVRTGDVVTLDNDEDTPAAGKYYGTDELGARGYHPLPSYEKSVVKTGDVVALENDEDAPAASKYYGTDELGGRGYHDLPSSVPDSIKTSAITFGVQRSAGLVAGVLAFASPPLPYAATIIAVSARIPQPRVDGPPLTFRFRKTAYGSAGSHDPFPGESINTAGLVLIADGTTLFTDLSDFTTLNLAAGDIIVAEITDTNGVPTAFQCALHVMKT